VKIKLTYRPIPGGPRSPYAKKVNIKKIDKAFKQMKTQVNKIIMSMNERIL
jgi:hypothetical protein